MKSKYILIAIAAVFTLSLQSCSLEEDTSSISTPDNFFRKYSECQSVVNGCYMPMKSIYNYTYLIATECVSDVLYINSSTLDAVLEISPSVPRYGSTVWTQGYLGVQRCNFAVAGITRATNITDSQREELLCEAKVLRAFYYLTLTSFFGNVPFYFDDVADNETMDRIAELPRMSADSTRAACINDLLSIVGKVSQKRTADITGNRLLAAPGWMLIAKMAMWNASSITNKLGDGEQSEEAERYWDIAIDALKHLETIYGSIDSYPFNENVMFRIKNKPESIMEIQHVYTLGGLTYTSNAACICTPTIKRITDESGKVIGATYDGVEIPELGYQATTWNSMRPNAIFCQGLQKRYGKDIRKDMNMAWEYNGKQFASVSGTPWMGPKFWCPDMMNTQDGNNYTVYRFADAILMLSECYCEKKINGGTDADRDESLRYLNMIRKRAETGDYTYRTDKKLRQEIRDERARELLGEFQRKFDLVKWGIWYDEVVSNTNNNTLKENIRPCHEYYPIPDKEVVYSHYHLDNNAYKAYGL